MRRFRIRRRRAFAFALTPVLALSIATTTSFAQETGEAVIDGRNAVVFGNAMKLRGRFPGAPNASLAVEYRRPGAQSFRRIADARTDGSGRWAKWVKPSGTGAWRARLTRTGTAEGELLAARADSTTDSKKVRVRSVTNARVGSRHVVIGNDVRIRGRVKPGGKRRVKVIAGGQTIRTRANRRGRFSVTWKPPSLGRHRVKAVATGNRRATWSMNRAGRVTAYRYAHASWYGPGFYGNRTACGQTLTTSTVGVAHKSLPCGTRVTFRYRGKSVTAPVIDRGPYVAGREYDLTSALRNKLGFGSTGTVMSTK